jgi:hypothetical protein
LKKKNSKKLSLIDSWQKLFFLINYIFTTKYSFLSPQQNDSLKSDDSNAHLIYNKEINVEDFIKNFLKNKLDQIESIFSYYIYNVDKNIRKFTRGKSGKYIFIWKYIAPYKRKFLSFRWFLHDVKFDESREIKTRFKNLFHNLLFNFKNTYAWKSKNYTYFFIFKNFRKSLMIHLRTTTK